jgi:hypothetical protein
MDVLSGVRVSMNRIVTILFWLFLAAYVVALALYLISLFGLFGSTPDPLSGIFLVPLGLPWNRLVDYLPESMWAPAAAASPLINLAILYVLKRRTHRRSA